VIAAPDGSLALEALAALAHSAALPGGTAA
jgi:hypothetical protein